MTKRILIGLVFTTLAILPGTGAQAAVDVNITGKVVASACTVSPVLAGAQEVNLGTLGRTKFQNAGDAGDWKSFSLSLTNCPAGTSQSTATFTGTPDGTDATLFANTEPVATAASHIAVQMVKDADHSAVLSTGSTLTANVNTTTKTVTFPLAARLYTPSGGVQAGQVSSSVLVNFTYQ